MSKTDLAEPMAVELLDIQPHTRTLTLVHPGTGAPVGLDIVFQSPDEKAPAAVVRQINDRRLKLQARGKDFTAEEIEENGKAIILSMAVGWKFTNDTLRIAGQQPEFSTGAMSKLLTVGWVREFLDGELQDKSSFFRH